MVQYTWGRLEIARDAHHYARQAGSGAKIWRAALGADHPLVASVSGDLASLDNDPGVITHGVSQAKRAVERAEKIAMALSTPKWPGCSSFWPAFRVNRTTTQKPQPVWTARWPFASRRCHAAIPIWPPRLRLTPRCCAVNPPQNERADKMQADAKDIRAKHVEEDQVK